MCVGVLMVMCCCYDMVMYLIYSVHDGVCVCVCSSMMIYDVVCSVYDVCVI